MRVCVRVCVCVCVCERERERERERESIYLGVNPISFFFSSTLFPFFSSTLFPPPISLVYSRSLLHEQ